jgi:hypothetical protein
VPKANVKTIHRVTSNRSSVGTTARRFRLALLVTRDMMLPVTQQTRGRRMKIEKTTIESEISMIKMQIEDIKSTNNKGEKRETWNYVRGKLGVMLSLNLVSIGMWQELSDLNNSAI